MPVDNASLPEYNGGSGNFSTATPGITGNSQLLYGLQKKQAQKFRQDIPQTADAMYNPYAAQSRSKLASDISGVRKSYNSRGLLHSGQRMGSEAGARASNAVGNATYAYGLNKQLLGDADSMDSGYANTAMGMAGMAPQLGGGLLNSNNQAIQDELSRQRADAGFLDGLTSLYKTGAGALLGRIGANSGNSGSGGGNTSSGNWYNYMTSR